MLVSDICTLPTSLSMTLFVFSKKSSSILEISLICSHDLFKTKSTACMDIYFAVDKITIE